MQDCDQRLYYRTKQVMDYVKVLYKGIELNENQIVALTSIYYNVRQPNHVYWRIHNGYSSESVANAFHYYNAVREDRDGDGIKEAYVLRGLERRRSAESKLYLSTN